MKIEFKNPITEKEFSNLNNIFDTVDYVENEWNEDEDTMYESVMINTINFSRYYDFEHFILKFVWNYWYTLSYNKEKDKYFLSKQ